MNISVDISTQSGNRHPGAGGVLTESAAWDDLIDNTEWAYVTVVANNAGVYFYENSKLLCSYTAADAANVWDAFMYQINNNGTIKFFGNNEGTGNFYIDDLLLTTGLDADGVDALYASCLGLQRDADRVFFVKQVAAQVLHPAELGQRHGALGQRAAVAVGQVVGEVRCPVARIVPFQQA